MAKLIFRKKVVLAKTETTYGTDPTPTASANAILFQSASIEPIVGEGLSRDLDKSTFGADAMDMVGQHVKLTLRVEAAGSGTAGTAPAYGPLLKACGYSETVVSSTSVTYAPIDDGIDSLTQIFQHDKKFHKLTGSRGSVKFVAKKRGYPYFEFVFMGLYNTVTAGTISTPTLTAFRKPVPFRASTVSCTLLGETIGLHEIDIDFGQKVNFYEHSEEESIVIEDREGAGNVMFELPEIGDYNFYTAAAASTLGALTYVHGTTAGNIITINAPNVQIADPRDEDVQGITALRARLPLTTDGSTYDARIVFT